MLNVSSKMSCYLLGGNSGLSDKSEAGGCEVSFYSRSLVCCIEYVTCHNPDGAAPLSEGEEVNLSVLYEGSDSSNLCLACHEK